MATDTLCLTDMKYKDADPMQTVQRIREILRAHNIEVSERWHDSKVPYCYSLRVQVKGGSFGVNGKGLTRELTLASAYGELMERLQLGYLGDTQNQKTGNHSTMYPTTPVSARELYAQNPDRYERIASRATKTVGRPFQAEESLLALADKVGCLDAVTFVELSTGNRTLFPSQMLKSMYSANGCAAGNTPEEAIVQAISEVVERHHHMRILDEHITLPDIPESVLERYPIAYNIITFLRNQGFRVLVRDASLGMGFAVVCLYIIDPKTGSYHTHFGAYPVFEIALNRALTESFQGRSIDRICQHSQFYTADTEGYDIGRISVELVKGTSEKPLDFFVGTCAHSYDPHMGFTGGDNRALLRQCLDMFRREGLEVLVRDSSALGFPTYQVVVPGYSEVFLHRLNPALSENRYGRHVRRVMSDPTTADFTDFIGVAQHMELHQKYRLDRMRNTSFSAYTGAQLDISGAMDQQLAYCALGYSYYELRHLPTALKCLQNVLTLGSFDHMAYAACLCRYLQLVLKKCPAEQIRDALAVMHDEAAVAQLYDLVGQGKNLFAPLVFRCAPAYCGSCSMKEKCSREKTQALSVMIKEAVFRLDAEAFCAQIRELIS